MLPPQPPGQVDWARVDRKLCEAYSLTPPALDAMTLPEIAVLCIDGEDKGPAGGRGMSEQEADAEIRAWKAMTPLQRLDKARGRRDA